MAKKYPILVAILAVLLAVPANLAEAVSIGQICQKLGTKSTVQVKKVKVPVTCLLRSKRKIWVRTAVQISTTTTSTTLPPKDFVDLIKSVESDSTSLHRMIFSDGVVREYILALPINYDPQVAYPLAIGLHGVSGTASSTRTLMSLESGPTSLIAAYPLGLNLFSNTSSAWNAGTCCEPATSSQQNDVKFISRLIDSIENQFNVDKSRVWAVGYSNGGMMAYRLGCEISDQITGIGVGAGTLTIGGCTPTKKFSVIHIHGDLDDSVPINGGGHYSTPSVVFSVGFVAHALGCTNDMIGESIISQVWLCPNSMEMKLMIDIHQDHDWKSNWSGIIVQFLQSHPRN